jgi:hypothetical protein
MVEHASRYGIARVDSAAQPDSQVSRGGSLALGSICVGSTYFAKHLSKRIDEDPEKHGRASSARVHVGWSPTCMMLAS